VSKSSTFYEQLLCAQILKAQIKTVKLLVFLVLLGYAQVKAAHRMLMKLNPGGRWQVTLRNPAREKTA